MADEVYGTLARVRSQLSELRGRVAQFNDAGEVPESHTRVVMYVGQCLIPEGNERDE